MLTLLAASAMQIGTVPPPLHSGSKEFTCPVGGERFSAPTALAYSISGRRPDGKPYSELPFPVPIPECPTNGLVMFDTFTPTETQQLAAWVSNPTFQAMRKSESEYYRAYWLAVKIGRPAPDAIELLLPAIWDAKNADGNNPHRPKTVRYQRALIAAVERAPADVQLDDRLWLYEQAANASREMGRFDDARRWTDLADGIVARTTRPPLADYLGRLKTVIARQDRSDEPLDMIPDVQAAILCEADGPKNAFARTYCARPEIARIFTTKQ